MNGDYISLANVENLEHSETRGKYHNIPVMYLFNKTGHYCRINLLVGGETADIGKWPLTQDVNKSGKNFQMRKNRFFSLLVHKNLIQYDEEW